MKNIVRFVVTVCLFVIANGAFACLCKLRAPFETNSSQIVEQSPTIMVVEVTGVTRKNVTVIPIEIFKGKISKPLIYEPGIIGCDYFGSENEFARIGDRHLFFNGSPPVMTSCGHSAPIKNNSDMLEIVRKHFKKIPGTGAQKPPKTKH